MQVYFALQYCQTVPRTKQNKNPKKNCYECSWIQIMKYTLFSLYANLGLEFFRKDINVLSFFILDFYSDHFGATSVVFFFV